MEEFSAGWVVAEVAWGITIGTILTYFWLTSTWLITLSAFLALDVIFWLLDSYIVTQDTSSRKLIEWLARKFWRRALPFVTIAALRWIGYDDVEMISNIVMSILILSEWYSVVWHIYSINFKEKLPEIDALKFLIEKVAEIFKWQMSKKKVDEWDSKE